MKVNDIKVNHVYLNKDGYELKVQEIDTVNQNVYFNEHCVCYLPLFAHWAVEDLGEVEQ